MKKVLALMMVLAVPATGWGCRTCPPVTRTPLVQVALLLDTSNSMDGLIAQAKSQLWRIVNELGAAERRGRRPTVQVALYEYGNSGLSARKNYIRQVIPFTTDLDEVSERLFGLSTNGGDEYCGAVIQKALADLAWDRDPAVYKTIFIAGNEPFNQGPADFREAIVPAVRQGIVVNTIFCGTRQEGVATCWKDGARAGRGEYFSIDASRDVVVAPTPYDDQITSLGSRLDDTYVPYGAQGRKRAEKRARQDKNAEMAAGAAAPVERSIYKASPQYSTGAEGDAVTELTTKNTSVNALRKDLPAPLQAMDERALESHLRGKAEERKELETKIQELTEKRRQFLSSQEKSNADQSTLDSAMIKTIRQQAAEKEFQFK